MGIKLTTPQSQAAIDHYEILSFEANIQAAFLRIIWQPYDASNNPVGRPVPVIIQNGATPDFDTFYTTAGGGTPKVRLHSATANALGLVGSVT